MNSAPASWISGPEFASTTGYRIKKTIAVLR